MTQCRGPGKKAGWKGGRSVSRLATEPRYLLSLSHRGLLPPQLHYRLQGCGGKRLLENDTGPEGPIHARELPPSLPVSSSISRPFSQEPQAVGFLELSKYLNLPPVKIGPPGHCCSGPPGPSPTQPQQPTRKELTIPSPPPPLPSPCRVESGGRLVRALQAISSLQVQGPDLKG